MMYISAFPTLPFHKILRHPENFSLEEIYSGAEVSYHYRGAHAVYQAVASLKCSIKNHVLVPAYHCGIEIDAVLAAGAQVIFYGIREDLSVDLDEIKRKINEHTKAILLIHYFGFPQPVPEIVEICRQHKIVLIEDCAHAFLSRSGEALLGTFGDYGILSLRKSLPLPNGGVLISQRKHARNCARKEPSRFSTWRAVILSLLENVKVNHPLLSLCVQTLFVKPAIFLWRMTKRVFGKRAMVSIPDSMDFHSEEADMGMSVISERLLKDIDSEEIVRRRRENYFFLLGCLQKNRANGFVFRTLPQGVCPLFFPLAVDDRDKLQEKLLESGVSTFVFGKKLHPQMDKRAYPLAEKFSGSIICLPVHQDLDEKSLAYMAGMVDQALSQKAGL